MSASLAVAAAVSRTPFTQRRFVVARSGLQIIVIILIKMSREMFFFKSNLMYSRRLWKRRSDAKNGSRRTPYAGRAGQAERGHGGRLVVRLQELSPPVLHRGRGGVLREDLLVSLHHVRVVQVVVHDHAAFPLEQIKCG